MSTIRAQLCLGIISYILFQGSSSQSSEVQSPGFQQGSKPPSSSAPQHSSSVHSAPQSTRSTTESWRMSTQVTIVKGDSSSSRPSTLHRLETSSLGPAMKIQPLQVTSEQGTSTPSYKVRERSQILTSTASGFIAKSTTVDLRTTEKPFLPTPTSETVLTVAAFGVITFIIILVVVVIILVSVVSLRFKCRKNKESEDPQKPESSGISESCSTSIGQKDTSITLISMKNINSNNNKGCFTEEKVL